MSAAEDEAEVEKDGQVVLFNRKFEGQKITDFRLHFGGNVELGDPDIINALKLGDEVTLVVKGRIVNRGHKIKTAKDQPETAVSSSTVLVETVALEQ